MPYLYYSVINLHSGMTYMTAMPYQHLFHTLHDHDDHGGLDPPDELCLYHPESWVSLDVVLNKLQLTLQ